MYICNIVVVNSCMSQNAQSLPPSYNSTVGNKRSRTGVQEKYQKYTSAMWKEAHPRLVVTDPPADVHPSQAAAVLTGLLAYLAAERQNTYYVTRVLKYFDALAEEAQVKLAMEMMQPQA